MNQTQSGEYIMGWLAALDEVTYFELFGVDESADEPTIRAAFHEFCDTFHPDRHVARTPDQRAALSAIFKRGTEAFLVLSDARLRAQYIGDLSQHPRAQPPRMTSSPALRSSEPPGAKRKLRDSARSPSARPFAEHADELLAKGQLRKAKLQLVMANHLDPDNEALEAALRELEDQLRG